MTIMRKALLLAILLVAVACSKIMEVDGDYHTSQIVLNSMFSVGDDTLDVFVTESTPIFGYEMDYLQDLDVEVKLFENESMVGVFKMGKPVEIGPYSSGYGTHYTLPYSDVKPDASYQLEVIHPTMGTATAEASFPTKVSIESVELKSERIRNDYGETYNALVAYVTFIDPPGENNYYQVEDGYTLQGHVYTESVYDSITGYTHFSTTDTVLVHKRQFPLSYQQVDPLIKPSEADLLVYTENQYNVFSDELIDGKAYTLRYVVHSAYGSSSYSYDIDTVTGSIVLIEKDVYDIDTAAGNFISVHFNLRSISKEFYMYCNSVELSYWNDDSPFSEPVQIYSNVDNGIGIMATYLNSSSECSIGQYPMEGKVYPNPDEFYY